MAVPWHRIEAFSDHFARCAVTAGETAVVLAEADSRPELVEVATVALERLGAAVATVVMPTPANPGPVPIRSTGASVALGGHRAAIAGLAAADFIVDCTVEGLLHAVERPEILAGGARVLMLSNEHPEVFDRVGHDPSMADRVAAGRARLAAASTMRVTSAAGTDRRSTWLVPSWQARTARSPTPAASPTGRVAWCCASRRLARCRARW